MASNARQMDSVGCIAREQLEMNRNGGIGVGLDSMEYFRLARRTLIAQFQPAHKFAMCESNNSINSVITTN